MMPAYDTFHEAVRRGLLEEGWTITDDPLIVQFGSRNVYVDPGTEKGIGAERDGHRIAVEIKSFIGPSILTDSHLAAYDPEKETPGAMGDVTRYRELVQGILAEYASYKPSYGDVEVEKIFMPRMGHYPLMSVGWHGQHRIHGCLLHVDIKGGRSWIQHDRTEEGIAGRPVADGVPREDSVPAFHSPFLRKFTDFAVS